MCELTYFPYFCLMCEKKEAHIVVVKYEHVKVQICEEIKL